MAARAMARRIASIEAWRILSRAISATEAAPKRDFGAADRAAPPAPAARRGRRELLGIIEQFGQPARQLARAKLRRRPSTGPASGPRPTSSTPATRRQGASSCDKSGIALRPAKNSFSRAAHSCLAHAADHLGLMVRGGVGEQTWPMLHRPGLGVIGAEHQLALRARPRSPRHRSAQGSSVTVSVQSARYFCPRAARAASSTSISAWASGFCPLQRIARHGRKYRAVGVGEHRAHRHLARGGGAARLLQGDFHRGDISARICLARPAPV